MDERQILWIVYLLAVFTILLTVSIKLQDLADDTLFKQKFLAVDLASIEDSVMSAPGDISVSYRLQESFAEEFTFGFKECGVFVSTLDKTLEQGSSFSCSEDSFLEKRFADLEENRGILFKKEDNTLSIEKA